MNRVLIVVCLVVSLTSCTYVQKQDILHNQDHHALNTDSVPPLKIPPGINSSGFHNEYPIANRNYTATKREIDLTPPGLND